MTTKYHFYESNDSLLVSDLANPVNVPECPSEGKMGDQTAELPLARKSLRINYATCRSSLFSDRELGFGNPLVG